jgi:hypothetical protein
MNYGTKTQTVDSDTKPAPDAPVETLVEMPTGASDERKAQREILNRLVTAVDDVMQSAQKPALVWAILKGVFIDQKTVAEVAAEQGEPDQTGRNILAKLCQSLKSVGDSNFSQVA